MSAKWFRATICYYFAVTLLDIIPDLKDTAMNVKLIVSGFDHAALLVRDLDRSKRWYSNYFAFNALGPNSAPSNPYIGNATTKLAFQEANEERTYVTPVNQGLPHRFRNRRRNRLRITGPLGLPVSLLQRLRQISFGSHNIRSRPATLSKI